MPAALPTHASRRRGRSRHRGPGGGDGTGRARRRRRRRRTADVPRWPGRRVDRTSVRRQPGWPMNRGFHAFFRQYYNLRNLLRRVDPQLVDADAGRRLPAHRRARAQGHLPWPAAARRRATRMAFALRSPTFRLRDLCGSTRVAAAPLAAVSVPDIYHRLDHRDAETFLRDINFPDAARHLAFEVFSRSFFAEPDRPVGRRAGRHVPHLLPRLERGLALRRRQRELRRRAVESAAAATCESIGVPFHTGVSVTDVQSLTDGSRCRLRCRCTH